MEIAVIIESIIVNMFSTDLTSARMKWIDKCRLKRFKKDLNNYVRKFIINHDGTVLTTGDFERFLEYYHPVEYAFRNISGSGDFISKDQFISNQLKKFWDSFPNAKDDCWSRSALKDFITAIYDKIESFYKTGLSKNEKYLVGVVGRVEDTLKSDIDRAADKIGRKIDSSTGEISNKLDRIDDGIEDILGILKKPNELDKEEVWKIFSALSTSILCGNIGKVNTIVPLLKGKSTDLEVGIKYYFDLFQGISNESNSLSMIENIIEDDRIYQDLAEKTIYLALILKSDELLNQIGNRSLSLCEIKGHLISKKYDVFYSCEMHRKDGVSYIEYKLQQNYPGHEWLVKRICALSILEQPIANASGTVLTILDEKCLIDRILIYERKVNEYANKIQINEATDESLGKTANDIKHSIAAVPKEIQSKFYISCLRWGVIRSIDEADHIAEEIPSWVKDYPEIQMLLLEIDINKGTYDIEHIMAVCDQTNQYWLFNNLLVSKVNDHPEEAKKLLDNYRYVIDKDPMLFLIYVQLTYSIEEQETAQYLFDEYEEKYGSYLEYWVTKLRSFYSERKLNEVAKKWLNSEYEILSYSGNLDFIRLLMEHHRYSDALQGVLQVENSQGLSAEYLRIKAIALLNTKHEIEALEAFNQLFEGFNQSDETVFYIIMLSINNKRTVSDSVIEYGKKSENPEVLLVTAQYLAISNETETEQLLLKAMLRTKRITNNGIRVFGQYLGFHIRGDNNEEIIVNGVDANTVVYLQDIFGTEKIYCVHGTRILPNEFYEWENAIHIYKETAIRLGLIRKKSNDNVVVDSVEYTITKIESLDYFLFHIAIGKLVQAENVKVITTQTDNEGHINIDMFKEQLKQQLGDTSDRNAWVEQYKNFKEMPASIQLYSKFVSVSYTQLIDFMIQDPSIIIREVDEPVRKNADYVISTASAIFLKRIGFDLEKVKEHISISSSLKQLISNDADITINDNNREHVTSMGMENGQLYFLETPDEVKQKYMADAIALKDYYACVNCVVNTKDLPKIEDGELDVKEFLGIADYDALSIAKEDNKTLLASEIPLAALAKVPVINVETVGIAGFLSDVCSDYKDILKYTEKLIDFRCLIPFNDNTVRLLSDWYVSLDEEEGKHLVQAWQEILLKPLDDDVYKELLLPYLRDILGKASEGDNTNPVWSSLLHAAIKYSGYTVRVGIADGKIYTQLIKDE